MEQPTATASYALEVSVVMPCLNEADTLPLTPPEARRLLRGGGFEILQTDFLFIFPRMLKWLRGLEARLVRWPLGAQYQVL